MNDFKENRYYVEYAAYLWSRWLLAVGIEHSNFAMHASNSSSKYFSIFFANQTRTRNNRKIQENWKMENCFHCHQFIMNLIQNLAKLYGRRIDNRNRFLVRYHENMHKTFPIMTCFSYQEKRLYENDGPTSNNKHACPAASRSPKR